MPQQAGPDVINKVVRGNPSICHAPKFPHIKHNNDINMLAMRYANSFMFFGMIFPGPTPKAWLAAFLPGSRSP
jgi:hypothetical protein